ncbi:DUF3303 family protein [Nocardia sp. NPDC004860]|uniref:DUF3303 domain-containing protein n=1 Tax=Nocardia sp. NPDC004860 TaxID=3154557 RepID=UPI0033AA1C60
MSHRHRRLPRTRRPELRPRVLPPRAQVLRCYQLMKSEDPAVLDAWFECWHDLIAFHVVPVTKRRGRRCGGLRSAADVYVPPRIPARHGPAHRSCARYQGSGGGPQRTGLRGRRDICRPIPAVPPGLAADPGHVRCDGIRSVAERRAPDMGCVAGHQLR